jgi:hypothetical protein
LSIVSQPAFTPRLANLLTVLLLTPISAAISPAGVHTILNQAAQDRQRVSEPAMHTDAVSILALEMPFHRRSILTRAIATFRKVADKGSACADGCGSGSF